MNSLNPYEIIDGNLAVQARFLFDGRNAHAKSLCLIGVRGLQKRIENKQIKKVRAQAPNYPMLIDFASLPVEWKTCLIEDFGEPQKQTRESIFAKNYVFDSKANDFYLTYTYGDGRALTTEKVNEYTINASVLNVLAELKEIRTSKRKNIRMRTGATDNYKSVWETLVFDCNSFREIAKHTLPENADRLARKLSDYKRYGYACLIHGLQGKANAKKVVNDEQNAVLAELICHHNNLNNEKIAALYNVFAAKLNWKTISADTVDNYAKQNCLAAYAGKHGETEFRNKKAMLVKRTAPVLPLQFITLDGWDAELLFQKEVKDGKGHYKTTYHNRLTIVVVLDPCVKYPIGYAIGTHETPDLIKAALKNAIQHTKELFGEYYKPLQIQSDRYAVGKKTGGLADFYQSLTKYYTPARAKNAKAKSIERYFRYINETYCQLLDNWSGHGITSRPESQPNSDYLDKIKKTFPTAEGVAAQLHSIMQMERQTKLNSYLKLWENATDADKLPMDLTQYLSTFGAFNIARNKQPETIKLDHEGITPKIGGVMRFYDSFDVTFRRLAHIDWIVKYDVDNLNTVLAESKDGTYKFLLEQKYLQPTALVDRSPEDALKLKQINDFNSYMIEDIIDQRANNSMIVRKVLQDNPQLNGTVAKLVLTDSTGQHKNQRNLERAQQALKGLERKQAKADEKERKETATVVTNKQLEYLRNKVNQNEAANA